MVIPILLVLIFFYTILPIDIISEYGYGKFGLIDDIILIFITLFITRRIYIHKIIKKNYY